MLGNTFLLLIKYLYLIMEILTQNDVKCLNCKLQWYYLITKILTTDWGFKIGILMFLFYKKKLSSENIAWKCIYFLKVRTLTLFLEIFILTIIFFFTRDQIQNRIHGS